MADDRANNPNRVIDLNAYRATKQRFGKGALVEHKPSSSDLTAHEDTAMRIGNPTPPKPTLSEKQMMLREAITKLREKNSDNPK